MDPAVPFPAAPPRLWSLDVLRGGCVLVVFLSHWHLWSDFAPTSALERSVHAFGQNCYDTFVTLTWPTGGHHPAVICFFVLSGFCIHYPFAQRAQTGQPSAPWSNYFARRFRRIMPVYWTACLLGLAVVAVERAHPSGSLLLALHALAPVDEIVVRLAGLSGLYPREIFAGNYLLTTVSVEILMYLLYPWFHFHAIRGRWAGLGVAFALMQLAAVLLLERTNPFWVFNSVLMLGVLWYGGALAAHSYVTRRTQIRGIWFLVAWLGFLGLKTVPHFYGLNILRQDVWALVCAFGVLWALHREALHPAARDRPMFATMRWTGRISYSLYAIHTPVIMLVTWVLLVVIGSQNYLLQVASTFLASAAITLLTYYGIERAFYRPRNE